MDKHRIHMAVYKQKPLDSTDEEIAEAERIANVYAKIVQSFFREQFGHIWDVRCKGFAYRGDDNVYSPHFARDSRREFLESREDQTYQPTHHMMHNGNKTGFCGRAGLGGIKGGAGTTYSKSSCGTRTMCHEFGHTLGYHHSTYRDSEGNMSEYGDTTSIMGHLPIGVLRGFNSPQRIFHKVDAGETILHPTETQQVLLTPIEMHPKSMREGEYKHIVFDDRSIGTIYISTRKELGYQYAGGTPNRLYVHTTTGWNKTVGLPMGINEPGEEIVFENGVKIEYLEYKDEVVRLNIYMNENDPRPEDIPMPDGFPAFIPTVELNELHDGAWANLNYNGQGFDLHVKDGRMVLFWYTYNMDNKARRFYFGNTDLKPGTEEFDLFTTEDGTWDDPTKHKEVAAGKGQIYFYDDSHGVFNYNTPEHGRGSIELTPIVKSQNNPLDGAWGQPSRNGEGMTLRFTDNICSGMWYSYGPYLKGTSVYNDNTKQRWYVFVGEKDPDGSYRLDVYELVGSRNRCFYMQDSPEETKVGTAKVTKKGDKLIWEYDMYDTEGANGKGTISLEKVF